MSGLFTIDTVDPTLVFQTVDAASDSTTGFLHCYSRLPMRQLLRYVATNRGGLWWITEQEDAQAVAPDADILTAHLETHLPDTGDVVVIESLEWMVSKSGEPAALSMLQTVDRLARTRGFSVIFPVEPLAFESNFWARMRSIAPHLPLSPQAEVVATPSLNPEGERSEFSNAEDEANKPEGQDKRDAVTIAHLSSLPRAGFNATVLGKRMLQWKRMGFDVSALEPATLTNDMDRAHQLYAEVEGLVRQCVDALRRMAEHHALFSVSERERFDYRLMNLLDVVPTMEAIEEIISTR